MFRSAYATIVDSSFLYTTIFGPFSFLVSKYISPFSCTGCAYLLVIAGGGGNETILCDLEALEELLLLLLTLLLLPPLPPVEAVLDGASVKAEMMPMSLSSMIPVLARSIAVLLVFSVVKVFTKDAKSSAGNTPWSPMMWEIRAGFKEDAVTFVLAVGAAGWVAAGVADRVVAGTEGTGTLLLDGLCIGEASVEKATLVLSNDAALMGDEHIETRTGEAEIVTDMEVCWGMAREALLLTELSDVIVGAAVRVGLREAGVSPGKTSVFGRGGANELGALGSRIESVMDSVDRGAVAPCSVGFDVFVKWDASFVTHGKRDPFKSSLDAITMDSVTSDFD